MVIAANLFTIKHIFICRFHILHAAFYHYRPACWIVNLMPRMNFFNLQSVKSKIKKFESDEGKTEISGANGGRLGLFWSCDAGFAMNDDGSTKGNKNLFYTVPKEGSNVWVDGWVIPKYAKNTKAANYFIKYLMEKENSIANAEYAGAPTSNKEAMAELKATFEKDDDGFFPNEDFKKMYLDMMFPSDKTLKRCAIMGDFGEYYDKMTKMFIDVKAA